MENYDIDFVVTWVDGSDPAWLAEKSKYQDAPLSPEAEAVRYRDWELMPYWFRSVEQFAPWVHRIYFVTWGHVPEWLDLTHPKLQVITHGEYIPEEFLPTFNSNVIELHMHKMDGLAEHFVLFNDDMFLTAPVQPEDFFVRGLPCDMALMGSLSAHDYQEPFSHMLLNNCGIINRRFVKRTVLRENKSRFYSLKYKKQVIRNLLFSTAGSFSSFKDLHLPTPYLKSTFAQVWDYAGEELMTCSANRFRQPSDLSHWLMKWWQFCQGSFMPRSLTWGKSISLEADANPEAVLSGKYKAVCLNDTTDDIDFAVMQERLKGAFDNILGEKSSYEK